MTKTLLSNTPSPSQNNRLNSNSYLESGRSMVEMLGTLAVIGILSVIGLAGLSSAINSHKANTVVEAVNRRAILLAGDKNMGSGFTSNDVFVKDTDYTITCADINADFFLAQWQV